LSVRLKIRTTNRLDRPLTNMHKYYALSGHKKKQQTNECPA